MQHDDFKKPNCINPVNATKKPLSTTQTSSLKL